MRDRQHSSTSTTALPDPRQTDSEPQFPVNIAYIRVMPKNDPMLRNVPEQMLQTRTFYALREVGGQNMYISDDRYMLIDHAEEKEKVLLTLH